MLDLLRADLRYTIRGLLARPGFTIVVVLTLGLGIGANAAVFSAVQALLLRPLPFKDAGQLVRISSSRDGEDGLLSVPEQDDLLSLTHIIDDVALYTDQGLYNASGFGAPEELQATIATHNLFHVLGVAPSVGSTFPADADRSRRFELVISDSLWTRRFGRDPNIVGKTMTLDGAPGYYIHGVLPPIVNFPSRSDLFRSSGIANAGPAYQRRDLRQRMGLARLKPGVTLTQARSELAALAARLAREYPATNGGVGFHVVPIRDLYVGNVRPYLLLLLAAVTLVLFVACANVANLLLSRALARDREWSIRTTLGATRRRLLQQQLVECLALSVLGGGAGIGVAWIAIRLIARSVRQPFPGWMQMSLDMPTLAFLTAVALVAGLAAGLVAARRQGDGDLAAALKEGTRGSSSGARHRRLRDALVMGEVALAVVLVVGASLMVQSVLRLQRSDPGFTADGLLTFRVEMGWRAYDTHDKVLHLVDRAVERIRALPGVERVALDSNLPLSGKPRDPYPVAVAGQSVAERQQNPFVHLHVISPDYFATLQAALVRGRAFDDTDGVNAQPVAIISKPLAERLFPNRDPIGQRIAIDDPAIDRNWSTIVGIAAPVTLQQLAVSGPLDVYRPHRQLSTNGFWILARTHGVEPASLALVAPAVITKLDPDQSFFDVQVMRDRVASGIWQQQIAGALFAAFGALALVLAVVGLYAVLSHLVMQQRREIGVRLALGASSADIWRMVVGRGLRLTAAGVAAGLATAWSGARAIESLLFNVSPTDPWTFAGVAATLLATAVVASAIPARRATRVDPIVALRVE